MVKPVGNGQVADATAERQERVIGAVDRARGANCLAPVVQGADWALCAAMGADFFRHDPRRCAQWETALADFNEPVDDPEDSEHTAAERAAAASRSTWISVAVNIALSGFQITVGVLARSQGLIADGIHSLSDLVADFVVLFSSHQGAKEADAEHAYGHQRFENAASLVVGALLLAVGAGMAWSAIGKLENPESIPVVHVVALAVAAVALVAKEILFRYMLKIATGVKSSMLVANAWHARSDAASSLVVGIGIAGNLAGYPLLDPIAALIVGLMIAKMGSSFAWDALHELMDRGVDEQELAAIISTLQGTPGVMGVHDVRTRKMGDMIVVDAHIEVDATISVESGHAIAVAARRNVMERHRVLSLMTHVDPWRQPDLDHVSETVPTERSGAQP
jgi:cation diffusion facilitator family transporter